MEFFHYVNIFDTKGIEYLLVIAFMLAMVLFIRIVSRRRVGEAPGEVRLVPAEGRFLAPGHTSARLNTDGSLAICAGELAHHVLGSIDKVELAKPGEVEAGAPLAVLYKGDRALHLRAPAEGTIERVNETVAEVAEELEHLPPHERWLVRFRPKNLKAALASMHFAEDARRWLEAELGRMLDLLEPATSAEGGAAKVMADGGIPVRGLAQDLDKEQWERFERSFFEPTED